MSIKNAVTVPTIAAFAVLRDGKHLGGVADQKGAQVFYAPRKAAVDSQRPNGSAFQTSPFAERLRRTIDERRGFVSRKHGWEIIGAFRSHHHSSAGIAVPTHCCWFRLVDDIKR
jgi:hypothetical protein